MTLKAPFPYFGGKSKVAPLVWEALGNVKHYTEPFFGSGAVLLARPDYVPGQHVESVNDKDGHIANVWRSIQKDPDEVAKWCDWPVNHADLSARKLAMIANEPSLLEKLIADPDYCEPKMAGYWIWAASCWIGSGLTRIGQRPHISNGGMGVHAIGKRPHISNGGMGVHAIGKIPHISNGGMGVHAIGQIPHISDGGKGVRAIGQIPHISDGGKGEPFNPNIYDLMRTLQERLRYVRVVCGDWTRVCGGNWQDKIGVCGLFFDPPYAIADRDQDIYHCDDTTTVAHDVRKWAIERGDNPRYRIVIAGYDEHEELAEHGWRKKPWKAQGGYANTGTAQGKENAKREVLWFSPHCVQPVEAVEPESMFAGGVA